MAERKMILIAAVADNGVIGKENKLPWDRIPGDLPRFKLFTMNHAIVMGRRTYESFGSKPLPGRLNVVISRKTNFMAERAYENLIVENLESGLERAAAYRPDGVFYVIGGGEIYAQTIERANQLEITEVHKNPEGNAFFPHVDKNIWQEVMRENKDWFSFVTYIK
jgi:dihydrofolate reductase